MYMDDSTACAIDMLGRDKRDLRLQFGAVCWRRRKDRAEVLLLTSRRTRRWVVPKGWPMAGKTPAAIAAAEAWEEAGVRGSVSERCVGLYSYPKLMEETGEMLPCAVALYPLEVTRMCDEWPEAEQRKRRWLAPGKAARLVEERDLALLLKGLSLKGLRA